MIMIMSTFVHFLFSSVKKINFIMLIRKIIIVKSVNEVLIIRLKICKILKVFELRAQRLNLVQVRFVRGKKYTYQEFSLQFLL